MQSSSGYATPIEFSAAVLIRSLAVATVAFLCALPYLYLNLTSSRPLPKLLLQKVAASSHGLISILFSQLGLLLLLLFLCASLYFAFQRRYHLPDWRRPSREDFRPYWIWLAGLPLAAVSFHLAVYCWIDRYSLAALAELYPTSQTEALAKTLMNTATFLVLGRMGLLTLACGLFRRRLPANIAVAFTFAFLLLHTLARYGALNWHSPTLPLAIASTVAANLLLNEVFFRRGWGPAVALQLAVELKYPLYAGLLF